MIDTHCHLTYPGLIERIDQVIANARAVGVQQMVTIGTTPEDGAKNLALVHRFAGLHAGVGLHPHYADRWTDRDEFLRTMLTLTSDPGVAALGEMGLDRHYPDPPMDQQRRALAWQLELATQLDQQGRSLPIIIHNREATPDTLAMLRDSGLSPGRFVFHCFTGNQDELDQILGFGAMVGITGIVTFKNSSALAAAAKTIPMDRLLVETDAPYLTPDPHRKIRTNEPRFVAEVARFLARLRDMDEAEFVRQTDVNARRFFGLKD